jgi:hypothetical protein
MYKGHSIWDEEQNKYENEIIQKENSPDYHGQGDYNTKDQSEIYSSEKGEEKREEDVQGIEREVIKEDKEYQGKEATEEDVKKKAATDVHHEAQKSETKKKTYKSIEDAINKAMKEQKEVIYVDD